MPVAGDYSPEDVEAYQAALDRDFQRIDAQCLQALGSETGIRRALARNRERGPHLPLTFVNVPLRNASVIQDELAAVHRLLEETLDDPRHEKAYYQLPDRVHTTLLRVGGEADVTAVFERIRSVLDVPVFAYTLAGPHVTPDLIVVLELRTASASLLALRARMRARLIEAGFDVPVQTISHVTVARLVHASPAELRRLVDACAARRTHVHDAPAHATRVCVSRSRGNARYEDRCAQLTP